MAAHCQDCDGCCRVFEVPEVNKAFGLPCKYLGHTPDGPGCKIYSTRPDACKHYVCVWLDSQRRANIVEQMPEELRPDRCKVVMGWPWSVDRETMFIYPYPGFQDNWKKSPVKEYIQMVLGRGGKILVFIDSKHLIFTYGDVVMMGSEEEFADILWEIRLGKKSALGLETLDHGNLR